MEPEIVVTHIANSSLSGQEQRFRKDRVTVGRDNRMDIDFDPDEDLIVSHRHAEIYLENGVLYVRDLGSRNGTYVNERRVDGPVELHPEDTVEFGFTGPSAKVRLEDADAEPGQAERQPIGLTQAFLHRMSTVIGPRDASRSAPVAEVPQEVEVPGEVAGTPAGEAPAAVEPAPAAVQRRRAPARMPAALLLGLLAVLGAGLAAGAYVYVWPRLARSSAETPTAVPAPAVLDVAALGRLEPDGGVLEVGGPAGQTIQRLLVDEGQVVKSNDPLAHVDSFEALQAAYEAARAALDEANSQLQSTRQYADALVAEANNAVQQAGKPLDLEVDAAAAQVELLRAQLNVAREDRQQLEQALRGQASAQLTRQKLVEQAAERELVAAQKKLDQLRESAPLRRAQAQAQLQSATANRSRLEDSISVVTAQKNVDRAMAQLEQAIIRAPRDGKVLKIVTHEGAALGGQPILELGDTRHFLVNTEVYETDVRYVAQGQRATITSPALPEDLHGEVDEVLWTVERNRIRNLDPTAPEDLRVVRVKIRLDDGEVARHRALLEKLINLQVDVRIAVGHL